MAFKKIIIISLLAVIALYFLISFFKDDIKSARGKTRSIPEAFKNYNFLDEAQDSLFAITYLHDEKMRELNEPYQLFMTIDGNYILKLKETKYPEFQTTLYKINTEGVVLNSFKLPKDLYFFRGFILGKGIYSNWIVDNDTTTYKSEFQDEKITKDRFKDLYLQAQVAYTLSEDEYMMLIENKWQYIRTDFKQYSEEDKVAKGANLLIEETNGWPKDFAESSFLNLAEGFDSVPVTDHDLDFLFFEKLNFRKARTSQKIGSPTGGNTRFASWSGNGYFSLKFDRNNFCFKHSMNYTELNNGWKYLIPFEIFKTKKFAIIATKNKVFLVNSK